MEKIGSRTAPIEFESGRLSMIAIGARTVWLRPRNRALSVSNSGAPTASPSMTVRCAAQISGSLGRPLSPRGQDGSDIGKIFRFDEQLREGGMRDVGALGREDEFGVGRDLDVARAASGIRDRYPANFGVVLGGDDHVQSRRQRAVAARDLGAVLIEDDGVAHPVRRRSVESPPTTQRQCAGL